MPGPAAGALATPHRRARRGGWVLLAALALLLGAYVMGNPPGQASDEPAHFFKAAGLSIGEVAGDPVDIEGFRDWTPGMLAWISRTTRILPVPPGYAECDAFGLPQSPEPCPPSQVTLDRPLPPGTAVSYVATYSPVPYLAPAVAIRVASELDLGPIRALQLARLAGAGVALVFLAGAVRLLRAGRPEDVVSLAGAGLAITPIVVFTCAQVGGSGLEMSAGLCFGAGLLRLTGPAPDDLSPRAVWLWTGVSGLLLVTARTPGPLWLVLLIGLVLVLRGPRALARASRAAPVTAVLACVAVLLGTAASLAWQFLVEPRPETSLGLALRNLPGGVRQLWDVADMYVGRLGWISIPLPFAVVLLWWLLLLGLLAAAAWVGTARERLALLLSAAVAIASPVLLWAYATAPTSPEFRMQARYVMPVLTMVVLVAVDVLRAHGRDLPVRWGRWPYAAAAAVVGCTAVAHLAAFEINATVSRAWNPTLSWSTWEGLATAAAVLAVVGTARAAGSGPPAPEPGGDRMSTDR